MHTVWAPWTPPLSSCKSTPVAHPSCCCKCTQIQYLIYLASLGSDKEHAEPMPEESKNIVALKSACPIPYLLFLDFFVQKKNAASKPLKGIFCTVKKDITWHTMTYYSSCNWLLLFFYQQTACFGLNILSPISFVLKQNKNLLMYFFSSNFQNSQ